MADVNTVFKITAMVAGTNAVRDLANAVNDVSTKGDKVKQALGRFAGALRSTMLLYAVKEAINMADAYVMMNERIRVATRNTQEYAFALQSVKDIAIQTGTSMEDSVRIFQRIGYVKESIKATVEQMVAFSEVAQKLGVISGASYDAMKYGMLQLSQSLSSSLVRAEEFNSIMENVPAIGVEIAKQFGITTSQLRQLVVKAKVDSEDMFAALVNAQEDVRKRFASMPMTVSRAINTVAQQFIILTGAINESTNGVNSLAKIIIWTGDIIVSVVVAAHTAFTAVVGGLTMVYNWIVQIGDITHNWLQSLKEISNTFLKTDFSIEPKIKINPSGDIWNEAKKDIADFANSAGLGNTFAYKMYWGGTPQAPLAKGGKTAKELQDEYQKKAGALTGDTEEGKKAARFLLEQKQIIETLKEQATYIGKTKHEIDRLTDARKNEIEVEKIAAELPEKARAGFIAQANALYRVQDALKEINYQQSRTFGAGIKNFFPQYLESITDMASQIQQALTNAFSKATDALVDFCVTGEASFSDFATSIIKDLIKIQIQQSIMAPLSGLLNSVIGSFAPTGVSTPKDITIPASFANGGIMSSMGALPLKKYSTGGIASSPQLALFGEGRQKEAYVPLPDGRSIPVTMRGGSQSQNNVTVNINMADGSSNQSFNSSMAAKLGDLVAVKVKETLIDEQRAGGILSR